MLVLEPCPVHRAQDFVAARATGTLAAPQTKVAAGMDLVALGCAATTAGSCVWSVTMALAGRASH